MTHVASPGVELADSAARGDGNRWRMFAVGVVLGATLAGTSVGFVSRAHRVAEPVRSPFEVQEDTLKLRPGATLPVVVECTDVQLGHALSHPPVTARVTTVEALTAPSFAPLSGRVVDVRVRIGARVQQGEKLIVVRTADLAAMQRELRAAQLAVRTKQAIVDRLARLVEARAASNNDLMVAHSDLDDARFSAQAADAKLRSLMVSQDGETQYWVLASRSGTVVQLDAMPGKQVGPGADKPVATVADLDEVLILADVPQKYAAELNPGDQAVVTAPGTAIYLVDKIESVSEVVDPERQTVPVRIRAKNVDHVLRPNAYVDVTFSADQESDHVLVPSAAVVTDGDESVVFVQEDASTIRRQPVQVGIQTKDRVEILSGVKPGERVVSRGALLLLNAINVEG